MNFTVSVIIPVYNCESYIEKAIASALQQPEVFEVVVVNDGSTDGTQAILNTLATANQKIKVFHHENKINKGRSASRNLGIQKATGNYIAFLDADDYYLKDRFANDKLLFEQNKNTDGVYNAVGFHFYREVKPHEDKHFKINTVTQIVSADFLFEALIGGKYGYIHLNGLTVKKVIFNSVGLFNEALVVAEDSDLIFKMALKSNLVPSVIDRPLAKRGIHNSNIFDREDLYDIYNTKMYESVFFWSGINQVNIRKIDVLLKWIWIFKYKETLSLFQFIKYWVYLFSKTPKLIFTPLSLKYFPVVRLRQKLFPYLFKE